MSSTAAPTNDPADRARQRDEDAQYYRQILHRFIAMGTNLAEAVHRQALAEPAVAPQSQPEDEPASPTPSPTQAITFDRLACTVRRTIALARKLSEPVREPPGPMLRLNKCPKERRADYAETDALYAEPCERPDEPDCDADEDFDDQSFADLIANLRHDTGLATLYDAELLRHRTRPGARATVPSEPCDLCAHREAIPQREHQSEHQSEHPRSGRKAAGLTQATPNPGTGPPAPDSG